VKFIIKKEFKKKPKLKSPILIEGLPGIGNVGKIAADFIVESLNAKLMYQIFFSGFPHSVFITENGLVELPKVEIYLIKKNKHDFLILSGDIQPINESESYDFADKIIEICTELGCKTIVTLGGIGLTPDMKKDRVFMVATDKKTQKKYKLLSKNIKIEENSAATIVGAAGLLLGIGDLNGCNGISLLVETIGDPYHLGLNEAHKLLSVIEEIFKLGLDLKKFKREIKQIEKKEKAEYSELMKKLRKMTKETDTSYIG